MTTDTQVNDLNPVPAVSAMRNSEVRWIFVDPDGVKWPTYDAYVKWCRTSPRGSKRDFMETWHAYNGETIPDDVAAHNSEQGWSGHTRERKPARDEEKSALKAASTEHTSLNKMLVDRKQQHGDFNDHARCSQALKREFYKEHLDRVARGQPALSDTQYEAIDMILHKIARIVAGDPNVLDHWDDIAGYATIARERI